MLWTIFSLSFCFAKRVIVCSQEELLDRENCICETDCSCMNEIQTSCEIFQSENKCKMPFLGQVFEAFRSLISDSCCRSVFRRKWAWDWAAWIPVSYRQWQFWVCEGGIMRWESEILLLRIGTSLESGCLSSLQSGVLWVPDEFTQLWSCLSDQELLYM